MYHSWTFHSPVSVVTAVWVQGSVCPITFNGPLCPSVADLDVLRMYGAVIVMHKFAIMDDVVVLITNIRKTPVWRKCITDDACAWLHKPLYFRREHGTGFVADLQTGTIYMVNAYRYDSDMKSHCCFKWIISQFMTVNISNLFPLLNDKYNQMADVSAMEIRLIDWVRFNVPPNTL